MSSLNLVQIRNEIAYVPTVTHAPGTTFTQNGDSLMRVPFEAYVTITREGATDSPTLLVTSPGQSTVFQKKNKKPKLKDNVEEQQASTSQVPQRVPANRAKDSKKSEYNTMIKIAIVTVCKRAENFTSFNFCRPC